jgi:hypothetical protein
MNRVVAPKVSLFNEIPVFHDHFTEMFRHYFQSENESEPCHHLVLVRTLTQVADTGALCGVVAATCLNECVVLTSSHSILTGEATVSQAQKVKGDGEFTLHVFILNKDVPPQIQYEIAVHVARKPLNRSKISWLERLRIFKSSERFPEKIRDSNPIFFENFSDLKSTSYVSLKTLMRLAKDKTPKLKLEFLTFKYLPGKASNSAEAVEEFSTHIFLIEDIFTGLHLSMLYEVFVYVRKNTVENIPSKQMVDILSQAELRDLSASFVFGGKSFGFTRALGNRKLREYSKVSPLDLGHEPLPSVEQVVALRRSTRRKNPMSSSESKAIDQTDQTPPAQPRRKLSRLKNRSDPSQRNSTAETPTPETPTSLGTRSFEDLEELFGQNLLTPLYPTTDITRASQPVKNFVFDYIYGEHQEFIHDMMTDFVQRRESEMKTLHEDSQLAMFQEKIEHDGIHCTSMTVDYTLPGYYFTDQSLIWVRQSGTVEVMKSDNVVNKMAFVLEKECPWTRNAAMSNSQWQLWISRFIQSGQHVAEFRVEHSKLLELHTVLMAVQQPRLRRLTLAEEDLLQGIFVFVTEGVRKNGSPYALVRSEGRLYYVKIHVHSAKFGREVQNYLNVALLKGFIQMYDAFYSFNGLWGQVAGYYLLTECRGSPLSDLILSLRSEEKKQVFLRTLEILENAKEVDFEHFDLLTKNILVERGQNGSVQVFVIDLEGSTTKGARGLVEYQVRAQGKNIDDGRYMETIAKDLGLNLSRSQNDIILAKMWGDVIVSLNTSERRAGGKSQSVSDG